MVTVTAPGRQSTGLLDSFSQEAQIIAGAENYLRVAKIRGLELSERIRSSFLSAANQALDDIRPVFSKAAATINEQMDRVGIMASVMGFAIQSQFRYGGENLAVRAKRRFAKQFRSLALRTTRLVSFVPTGP